MVCACGDCNRNRCIHRMGDVWPGTALDVRDGRRGDRVDHRLSMRAWPCHADVDHGGVGRGAHSGILIRDAEALEQFERIDTIVIDKTGTLTEGKPKLVSVLPIGGIDENGLLRLAASVER